MQCDVVVSSLAGDLATYKSEQMVVGRDVGNLRTGPSIDIILRSLVSIYRLIYTSSCVQVPDYFVSHWYLRRYTP